MFGSKGKGKIFVSCCSNRNPEWGTILSIQESMRLAAKHGYTTTFKPRLDDSLICRARQNDLIEFLQKGADFLFSVDDDVFLPLDVLYRLADEDKDVIAGVYRLGWDKPFPAARLLEPNPTWTEILGKSLIVPCSYVSTGCMMISRRVIEKMIERYDNLKYKRNVVGDVAWALYMPYIHNEEYLSEDWAFCQRARDAGFEIWVHGGVKCGHMKKRLYQFGE